MRNTIYDQNDYLKSLIQTLVYLLFDAYVDVQYNLCKFTLEGFTLISYGPAYEKMSINENFKHQNSLP